MCGKTMTRRTMFKHKDSLTCKAMANACKYYVEMLDVEHKDDMYYLGRQKLQEIMQGEFDGGIKFSDEEKKQSVKFYEKTFWCAVKKYNEVNNITNDELANAAIKNYEIS